LGPTGESCLSRKRRSRRRRSSGQGRASRAVPGRGRPALLGNRAGRSSMTWNASADRTSWRPTSGWLRERRAPASGSSAGGSRGPGTHGRGAWCRRRSASATARSPRHSGCGCGRSESRCDARRRWQQWRWCGRRVPLRDAPRRDAVRPNQAGRCAGGTGRTVP